MRSYRFLLFILYTLFAILFFFSLLFIERITFTSQKEEKSLDFFCWGDTIELEAIEEFKLQTGISVHLHPFTSNEELIIKLKKSSQQDFDLICCSDYAIRILKEGGYLAPLDLSKIPNLRFVDPVLLSLPFDPQNRFSIPIEWEAYLFVSFKDREYRLMDLFEPSPEKRIAMTSDPIEAITWASYALFGPKTFLTSQELLQIQALLVKQKESVEAYVDHRASYLIETEQANFSFIRSGFAYRLHHPSVYLSLPKDFHFINIENVAICNSSSKKELAYLLINFLLSKEQQKRHSDHTKVFPVHHEIIQQNEIANKIREKNEIFFFEHLASEEDLRRLWISIKTA